MRDLVLDLIQCSTNSEGWVSALDSFNTTFNISSSCIFSVHELGLPSVDLHACSYLQKLISPTIAQYFKDGGDTVADAKGYNFLFESSTQQIFSELQVYDVDSWDEMPQSDVRDFLKSVGFVMRTSAVLNHSGPWVDSLFCQHNNDPEWQRFQKDKRLDVILPVLANSLSLRRTFQALKSRYNASLTVLDSLGIGVLLVDIGGNVIEHNKEAQRILDLKDGFSLTNKNRIKLNNSDKTNEFNSLLDATSGILTGEATNQRSIMASERYSGEYDYLISIKPVIDSQAELEVGLRCSFVTIIDPARKNALSVEGLALMGQLSNAEKDIAKLLVEGLKPSEVAVHRDVSHNTIKTQLKAISQKLRCSTQSSIIRAAAATRIPIEHD